MKPIRQNMMIALVLALSLALGTTGPAAAQGQSTSASAAVEQPVRALLDAMRRNDPAAIRAVFAPDASQAYGDGPAKRGDAFFKWLQSDIIDRHGQVAEPKLSVSGSEIVVTGQYRNNAGYASPANFLFRVDGDRIVSWRMRY